MNYLECGGVPERIGAAGAAQIEEPRPPLMRHLIRFLKLDLKQPCTKAASVVVLDWHGSGEPGLAALPGVMRNAQRAVSHQSDGKEVWHMAGHGRQPHDTCPQSHWITRWP